MIAVFKSYIQRLDLRLMIPLALMLALAPFFPVPHLIEKLEMWAQGTLHRPIDVFDLFMHSAGMVLLLIRFGFYLVDRRSSSAHPRTHTHREVVDESRDEEQG